MTKEQLKKLSDDDYEEWLRAEHDEALLFSDAKIPLILRLISRLYHYMVRDSKLQG